MLKKGGSVIRQALNIWNKNNPVLLSAGISYFALFSIVPAIIIATALAGKMFEKLMANHDIIQEISDLLSPEAASAVQGFFNSASHSAGKATVIGVLILFWGSTRAFSALQAALNIVWGVADKPRRVHHYLKDRIKAFLMILGAGFLLAVFFALDLGWAFVKRELPFYLPHLAVRLVVVSTSYALYLSLFTALFAMIFKFLPDARIAWRDVWAGAMVSAGLFAIARYLIALYFSLTKVVSLYGAAGSVIVLLIWIYFSTQILLFGAAFSRAWSTANPPAKI